MESAPTDLKMNLSIQTTIHLIKTINKELTSKEGGGKKAKTSKTRQTRKNL